MDIEHGRGSEHKKEFVNKVAEKLGMSPEKVSAALRDVRKERIDQAITERIQESVQNGVITQVEADRIREWWKNRPRHGLPSVAAVWPRHEPVLLRRPNCTGACI